MNTSLEKGDDPGPSHGFPALSAFLARDPDHETYIFRKFSYLTVRNLVCLQSDLASLEHQLKATEKALDRAPDLRMRLSLRDWEEFRANAEDETRMESKLQKLTEEVESKLEKYHNALLQASSIAHLAAPSKRVVDVFAQEFQAMDISGYSRNILEDRHDLVALRPAADKDVLSSFLREHWPFPTREPPSPYGDKARHFQDKHLQLLVSTLSVAIAALLLTGSIVTLYLVTSPDARLGLLIMFIMLFAIGIRVSTGATRDSIFAATAAYAAVLVVFVSGNLGNVQPG